MAQNLSIQLQPIFLKSSGNDEWKEEAKRSIGQAEAVIVFNPGSCEESDNVKWEIDKAKDAGIEIIWLSENSDNSVGESKLMSLYELEGAFNDSDCKKFVSDMGDVILPCAFAPSKNP